MTVQPRSLAAALLLLLAPLAYAQSRPAPTFAAPAPYFSGSSPDFILSATADFNGDGKADLAIVNFVDSSVSLYFGNGDGTFQPAVSYSSGTEPYGIVAADFNGDGKPDLAITNAGSSTVSILLNDGSGGFPSSPSSSVAVGSAPIAIVAGDLNRDGHTDLVVTNGSGNTLTILLGAGDGTFTAAQTPATGGDPQNTAIADVNGDGYADLAVSNNADNTVSILLNDKTGHFLPQVTYPTGNNPTSLALADFNRDGSPDLAVTNSHDNTVGILLNDKTGRFSAQTTFATGAFPISVLAQDLNADGMPDLAIANLSGSSLSMLLGKGDGTFSIQPTITTGADPWMMLAADFNGDGVPDLALTLAGTNNFTVYMQNLPPVVDVTTYHYDNARTGLNPSETILTPANVAFTTFGKLRILPADGKVDAEPLFLSSLNVNGQTRNVLYTVSEHGSAYAYDADTGALLWQVSALPAGETPSDDHGCNQISPEIGITDTPVIDRNAGAIFFVAMSKDSTGAYHQRLHALDLTNGHELSGSPSEITGAYPGTGDNSKNGSVIFDPAQYAERIGLLLLNNTLYLGWTSHCDTRPYTGWVMGYNESTLQQTSILNLTPNGNEGAIWMSGAGLAADSSSNIYFLDANGLTETTFNGSGFPTQGDYGNAIVKLSTTGGTLAVADFFEPYNTVDESNADIDLGSGGALLLPDLTDASGTIRHLLVGTGKDKNIYVADRDNLGKFNPIANTNLYQELPNALPNGAWSMPAYFNHTVYYGGVFDNLRAYPITAAKLATTPSSFSATYFAYPGATPSISANGTTNGIVWALESGTGSAAVLHAYDATNLNRELYTSKQAAGSRDSFGNGNKFITPVIIHGKVYVPTPSGVAVFGLLN